MKQMPMQVLNFIQRTVRLSSYLCLTVC